MTPVARRPARLARAAFALAVALNLLLLYWPSPPGDGPPHLDKAVHLLAFAAVAFTGLWALVPVPWLVSVLVLHAVVSEVVQARLLTGRSGDLGDVAADVVGILAGVLAGTVLTRASWPHEPGVPTSRGR